MGEEGLLQFRFCHKKVLLLNPFYALYSPKPAACNKTGCTVLRPFLPSAPPPFFARPSVQIRLGSL